MIIQSTILSQEGNAVLLLLCQLFQYGCRIYIPAFVNREFSIDQQPISIRNYGFVLHVTNYQQDSHYPKFVYKYE